VFQLSFTSDILSIPFVARHRVQAGSVAHPASNTVSTDESLKGGKVAGTCS
jgi:hypothetical protein